MITRIYLVRHGATSVNREIPYRLQGRGSDRSLDDLGIAQANAAARALAGIPMSAIYSSPLKRAMETAAIIGNHHELIPRYVDKLMEAEIGRWEGMTWGEAKADDPVHYERFHANPGTVAYPDGESYLDVSERAAPELAGLAATHSGESIVAVAHNIVNRAVLAKLIGLPIDHARALSQSNCGINIIEYEDDRVRVVSLNSILHLDG